MSGYRTFMANGGRRYVVFTAALLVPAAIVAVIFAIRGNASGPGYRALYEVNERKLSIVVTEQGVLQAKESEQIKADIDSQAKIIKLVDEGTYVKERDELVELDKSGIEALLERIELELMTAAADLKIADEEVRKYQEGVYPQKLKELDFAIRKAKAKLDKAQDEMPDESSEGIYSASEIRDARIAVEEADMNLEKAKLDESIYEEFTHRKNTLEKKTKADTARQKYESELEQKKTLIAQLEKMVMRAPCDGLVIYGGGSRGRSRRRGEEESVKVGSIVYKGQTIITLPNVSKMQVEARVHEVDIHKVKEGQKVDIRIEAFPEMALKGEVVSIGALAHDRDWRTRGVKVFDVTIDIDGTYSRLRPGMTAKVDIHIATIKNTLAIPIEAVFEDPEKNEKYCFVMENGEPEKRVIELGRSDDNFVVVKKGLKKGEQVFQYDVPEELGL